jgi:Mrp family chromosome partitioning ATPase
MTGPSFATSSASTSRPAPARAGRTALIKPDADNPTTRILTYLRLHGLTILFCGSLLGAALAYAAWTLLPPKYESYALFRVAQNPTTVSGASDPARTGRTEFATYAKTNANLLKSEFVYRVALRDYGLSNRPTIKQFRQDKEVFKFFDEKLDASAKEGSEIIRLTMIGDNPEDVQAIVNAIKDAYMKEVVLKEVLERKANREAIQMAKSRLAEELKSKSGVSPATANAIAGAAAPPDRVIQAGGKEPQPVVTDLDTDRMKQAMFTKLTDLVFSLKEKEIPDLETRLTVGKAELAGMKAKLQEALDAPPPEAIVKVLKDTDPDYLKAVRRAQTLRSEYADQARLVNAPSGQHMVELQRRAESAEVEAEKILRQKIDEATRLSRKPQLDELQSRITQAENALSTLAMMKEQKVKMLTEKRAELAAIPAPPSDPHRDSVSRDRVISAESTDLMTTEEIYKTLVARHEVAKLDADAPPRITELQPASTPVQKDSMKQILATVMAGIMGFVLVGALVTLMEMNVRKVSSLGELKAMAPVPVVGVIPWMPNSDTARDPVKRADVNEAIDKLRAFVAQSWLTRGATTLTVTSPLGDEGKAFTAFGLASSLAQAGYKTLLVDFDLRNPSLHPYAGVANALGVCELLRGEADFRRTIQVLSNGLHFLSAGKWSDEARQAAVGGRLEALLTRLKEPFDCVVLHGHALLTVAESVEVARRSEVVLLCSLYRETRGPMVKKAMERIATMEIPYAGVVYLGATPNEALC